MLRIPLPEDDGFALCTVRGGEGHTHSRLYTCTAEKRPSVFCVVFPYLSLSCLFGVLACYLSILSYPSPPARLHMLGFRR